MISLQQYNKINNSFLTKCVFHLGCEAGFFSEYNNMVLAMLYCLKNQIRFTLYSRDANFGFKDGWNDYFIPFCNEENNILHAFLNRRSNNRFKNKTLQSIDNFAINLFQKTLQNTLLTSDIWNEIRNQNDTHFVIKELNINNTLRFSCQQIIKMTWKYTEKTRNEIKNLINLLKLPSNYVGIHIRSGDKFIETDILEISQYIQKLITLTKEKNLFILTDDYTVIENLQNKYPEYFIYSLCDKDERGYFHDKFKKKPLEQKRKKMIKLFASMDIIASADLFIGTYSSNPGMYLGMRMEPAKTYSIDQEEWKIW